MLKKIFKIIQKLIFSILFLYAYNLIAAPIDIIIPINVLTVLVIMIFGMPALFALIAILLIMY